MASTTKEDPRVCLFGIFTEFCPVEPNPGTNEKVINEYLDNLK
jgi:hypothetical protein